MNKKTVKKRKSAPPIPKALKQLVQMNQSELNDIQKPIQQAKYCYLEQKKYPKDKIKKYPRDIIICPYCNVSYTRSNGYCHRKTKIHKAYVDMNDKIRKLLLNNN